MYYCYAQDNPKNYIYVYKIMLIDVTKIQIVQNSGNDYVSTKYEQI